MKFKILFWLFFLFGVNSAFSQVGLFINDEAGGIRVMNNTSLYIQGDFHVISINNSPIRQLINGKVYLDGDLICDDKIIFEKDSNNAVNSSTLQFIGTNDSYISGSVTPQIYKLNFDKTAGNVYINRNIEVHDTIEFIQGNGIIADTAEVFLKFRQQSNTVNANPYLLNERAASRFTGDGFVTTAITTANFYDTDIANTGFYFTQGLTDSLYLKRGHTKQLYAGEGSVDRYFDVKYTIPIGNTPAFDTVGMRYLADVNYAALGVDTSKLKMYVSPTFSDATFNRANDSSVDSTRRDLYDGSVFGDPSIVTAISPIYYRFTLGDSTCSNAPFANLPNSIIHLCDVDSINVSAVNQQVNGFPNSVSYFWNDSIIEQNRTFWADTIYREYIVKLTDQRGCFSYDTLRIAPVAPNPVPEFQWTNVCQGNATEFREQTTIQPGGTFTSSWNFGDGNELLNAANDTIYHTYSSDNNYTATLTATSNYNCVATQSHTISVFNYPVANLVLGTDCIYDELTVDGSGSTGTTNPVNSMLNSWTFKVDGTIVNSGSDQFSDPLNSYTPGNHLMEYIVISGVNCSDTVTQAFTIYEQDSAAFTVSNLCLNDTLSIQNTSVIYNPGATYSWNFGDATTSTDFEPVKVYNTPGIKIIQLIVQTSAPCADTFELAVNILPLPSSDFAAASACLETNVNFSPNTFDGSSSYNWDFGNSNTSNAAFSSTQYTSAGTYNVILDVTNLAGCSSQTQHAVSVMNGPNADFNALDVCIGNTTNFYNTSIGALSSQWTFGDFSNSTVTSPQHAYANAGNYSATLVVTDNSGCTDTTTQSVSVNALPVVPINSESTCGNSYLLDAENTGSTYLWSPSNETSQTITVTQDGTYSVQITDVLGCTNSGSATITLNSIVQPNLGADISPCGELDLNAGYANADYIWSTGDTINQIITINTPGTYWVEVTDQNGCIGSDTISIPNVYSFTEPDLGPDQTLCESNFPLNTDAGTYNSYLWSTGANSSSISIPGTSMVWVEVTDVNGCSGRDTLIVTGLNSPESLLPTTASGCDQSTLLATNNSGYNCLWSGGQTSNFVLANTSGQYTVIITDPSTLCLVQDTIQVTIQPSPGIDLGPDQSICANIGVVLNAQNPGSTYSWTSSSGVVVSTSQVYSPPSSGVYVVNIENNGCSASDAISVNLLPAPYIPVQTTVKYICGTTPVVLSGSPFGTNSWTSPNGFTSNDQNVSVSGIGNYTVLASIGGCSATETFQLETSPMQIEAYYLVDTDTSTNLSLKFIDLSSPTPISYLWSFGDGMFDTIPSPTHTYLVVDTFFTSLTVSNGYCISTYSKEVNSKNFFTADDPNASSLSIEDFTIYPNPTTNQLTIELLLTDYANTILSMYDLNGRVVADFSDIENEKEIQITHDLSALNPGTYYLRIQSTSLKGNVQKVAKLVKL
jgi:PKD repeat protein